VPDPEWPVDPVPDLLVSKPARPPWPAHPGRRQVATVAAGVAALVLATVAVAVWLPGEPPPASSPTSPQPTSAATRRPLPPDAPRDILLFGFPGIATLPALDQALTRPAPGSGAAGPVHVVDVRQLAAGRMIGLDRAGGALVALTSVGVRRLTTAQLFFVGLAGDDVWTVAVPPPEVGRRVVQRLGGDGQPIGGAAVVPADMTPVGEAADGLVATSAPGGSSGGSVVVVDPSTGAVRREIAQSARVADVRGGVVAWYHDPCRDTGDCLLHVTDTRTGAAAVVPSAQGVDRTVRGDLARLSPDGAWIGYPQALSSSPGDPLNATFELAVADTRGGAPTVVPDSPGVFAGMLPVWSGDRLLFLRARPPAVVGAYWPDRRAVDYGTVDVSAYDGVAGAMDLAATGARGPG